MLGAPEYQGWPYNTSICALTVKVGNTAVITNYFGNSNEGPVEKNVKWGFPDDKAC